MRTKKSLPAREAQRVAPERRRHESPDGTRRPDSGLELARRAARETGQPRRARKPLPAEIEAELVEVVAATGCELVKAEWKGGTLRLFIDRIDRLPSGVSLADCEHVAKLASALLDVLDFGDGRYLLEVSSPGLDRELVRPRDFERFIGRLVRVSYEAPSSAADRLAGAERQPARVSGSPLGQTDTPPRRRTVVARLADFRRAAAPADSEPADSEAVAAADSPAAAAPGLTRQAPSAGEVTLIDDQTGEKQILKLETIRLARLEVEL